MLGRSIRSGIGVAAVVTALSIILWLASGRQGTADTLAFGVGVWVGIFVAWGTFRRFDWRSLSVRTLFVMGIMGIVSALFITEVGYLVVDRIVVSGAFGLLMMASIITLELAWRLRKEKGRG